MNLRTLQLCGCKRLQRLPPLDGLKALQTPNLSKCCGLPELPLLDGLTALQVLNVSSCQQLQQLPTMESLAALQDLIVSDSKHLLGSCMKLPSTREPVKGVLGVRGHVMRVLKADHVVQ
jgi:hypothetical protein